MTDLTEKWKDGELEEGWYYILNQLNVIRIEQANVWIGRYENPFVGFDDDSGIKEVLAPVPSYEELQALKKELVSARYYQTIQNEDIGKLRALLKEVKEFIEEENPKDYTIMSERMDELLTKINEVMK